MSINNSKIVSKIKGFFSRFSKLKDRDLEKIAGAGEPEEFDWKPKGFKTPIKTKEDDGSFDFEPIGTNNPKDLNK